MVKMDMYGNEEFYNTDDWDIDEDEEYDDECYEEEEYHCSVCGAGITEREYNTSGMCFTCEALTLMMINGELDLF